MRKEVSNESCISSNFLGFVSGGALVIGAAVGYFARVPGGVVAGVMAFGSGVLISALSFELMEEAFKEAGLAAAATGFVLGAVIYTAANHLLAIWGARHRKRSGTQQPSEEEAAQADVEAADATIKQSEAAIKGYAGRVEETLKEYKRQKTLDKQGATSKRAVETAKANWVAAANQKANAEAQLLQMQASLSEAKANLAKAKADLGAPGDQNAQVRQVKAEVRSAELNLEFTQKKAPVDGYVTNLNLRLGSQAVENQPIMALVDVNSYWLVGFFRENYIEDIRQGDRTIITLMSYPDKPLEGRVDSLDWGISQDDGSTGFGLLPTISPTFEWIRLAQRVPVRIHLGKVSEGVELRVGTTASVLVMTGTSGSKSDKSAVAAPKALQ